MASRYEQFVAGQRQRAAQIREQALSGTLKPSAAPSTMSRAERFRQGQAALAEKKDPLTGIVLDSTLKSVGVNTGQPTIDMSPKPPAPQPASPGIDFKAAQAKDKQIAPFQGKLPAPSALRLPQPTIQESLKGRLPAPELLGKPVQPKPQTQYDITKQEIADSGAPGVIKAYADTMNWLTRGNPVGQALSNAFAGNSGVVQRDSTGNKVVDKATDIVNDFITPLLVPSGAPINMGPNVGTYEVAGKALSNKPGQAAVNAIAQGIGKIAPRVSPGTAQTIARQGLTETIAGPLQGVGVGLLNQQDSNEEIQRNALFGAAAGAGLGFAGAALGAGARSLFNRFMKAKGGLEVPAPEAPGPMRARVESRPGLNAILEQMKPLVDEYSIPPLENPNELAKWVQRNFRNAGDDISLNEIRTLGYEDLRQLSEEMRKNITVEEAARQVSKDLGYDFDKLLSAKSVPKDLVQRARRTQELHQAYGVDSPLTRLNNQAPARMNEAPPVNNPTSGAEVPLSREQIISRKYMNDEKLTQQEMDFMVSDKWNPNNLNTPAPLPIGEPILRPGQFDDKSGLGIAAGQRIKPYDSLKTETRSQLVTRQQRDPVSLQGSSDRAYTALVDDIHPLRQQDKILDDLMEEPLKASERIHTLGLASRGADVISKRIITDGLVDSQGQVVGESLKSILKPLKTLMKKNKSIYVDFEDYLLNKHAITRAERGEKVFRDDLAWTPDYGAQKVAEYEAMFPEFKEAADKFYAFNQQMVQSWLVDTGIITPETAQAWVELNPFYVPNKRQFTQLEKTGKGPSGGKKGFGNQSNPVKGYQKGGSQRKIISPIEATIENVDAYVKAAKRNQVMQQYVRNIEQAPDAFRDWAEIVKQPEKPADIKNLLLSDVTDESGAVVADGIDNLLSRFSDDFDAAMQRTRLDKDNIIRAMVDGEPVHVNIKDKQLLSALTALGPESAGWMLNWIGKVTNNMKLLTTGSNPVFSLTRNLFRDIPQAYIASTTRDNPIGFVADLVSAAIDIGGKRGAYKQFLDIGGGHASSIAADRNLLAQSKRAVLPQSGVRTKLARGKEAYENLLNAVEIAPRLAEFKRAFDQTGDLQAALQAAQDITVNFKRRGALSREIDKVFPYFNAAMQGLDKTVRTYKDNPAKALTKSILAITIPTLALYAMNYNDPNYQKLSRRQKDAFMMIPKGDGTFIKIAKPQEQGTIFSDIPERMMRLFYEDDPAAFRDFADRLRTTFTPPGLQGALKSGGFTDKLLGAGGDTIFGPALDIAANKTFSGAPVVPGYLENLSPGLQYDAKTTNVAKKIGEITAGTPFETSPKQLDYFVRQYTGFLGQFGQPLLSPGGDVGSALTQQVTADPVFTNDISTEFYRYKSKLDQANTDKDVKDLPNWYSNGLRKQMDKISKRMSAIRADMRDVQEDKSLSNKVKRDELRKLQQSINEMAEYGNELARDTVPY